MKKRSIILLIILLSILELILIISYISLNNIKLEYTNKTTSKITTTTMKKNTIVRINAVGDCTIGYDDNFGYGNSFNEVLDKNGYQYFFSNVLEIFNNDDLTIANLEGTFTEANVKKVKAFNFKGPLDYVNVLKTGSIEVVNLANNHTYDYLEVGYNDTINTLDNSGVNYFGNDNVYIFQKDDIKIGFGGLYCIEDRNCINKIDGILKKLKTESVNSIVLSFHWGIESSYKQSEIQRIKIQ